MLLLKPNILSLVSLQKTLRKRSRSGATAPRRPGSTVTCDSWRMARQAYTEPMTSALDPAETFHSFRDLVPPEGHLTLL